MDFFFQGAQLAYQDHPSRKGASQTPLLLLHGFPHNSTLWDQQIDPLTEHCRVITLDLRGHGRSELGDGHLVIDFFVDDVIALLDHLRVQQIAIAGLSMGGYIALRAVDRHPERFKSLILCNTGTGPDSNAGKLRRTQFIRMIREKGYEYFAEDFIQNVLMPKTLQERPHLLEHFREMVKTQNPDAVQASLIALAARLDMTESLDRINIPTLIISSSRDEVTPTALSEQMQRHIKTSKLVVIPDVGHLSNLEAPDEFNRAVLEFLQQV